MAMIKKRLIILCVFAVALVLSSCIQPQAPKAEFLEYKIAGITPQGIEVNFWFNTENPNPLAIDITKYNYKVFIEGHEVLAEERGGFNLPANGKKLIKIPVMIRYDKVLGGVLKVAQRIALGNDTISYKIEGSISAGIAGIIVSTPIKASGDIVIPKNLNLTL